MAGLKSMRSPAGPRNPNTYWNRNPRKKCSCGHRVRGPDHEYGEAHRKGKTGKKRSRY